MQPVVGARIPVKACVPQAFVRSRGLRRQDSGGNRGRRRQRGYRLRVVLGGLWGDGAALFIAIDNYQDAASARAARYSAMRRALWLVRSRVRTTSPRAVRPSLSARVGTRPLA